MHLDFLDSHANCLHLIIYKSKPVSQHYQFIIDQFLESLLFKLCSYCERLCTVCNDVQHLSLQTLTKKLYIRERRHTIQIGNRIQTRNSARLTDQYSSCVCYANALVKSGSISETRKDRGKVEKLLWTAYRNSPTLIRTVPSRTPYGLSFPKTGSLQLS